jgi:hypothetical protein
MKCNIIQDLLPSYIDGICSEETTSEVETHIKDCVQCNKMMQMMQLPTKHTIETNTEDAKEPFKRINKKRRLQVVIASLMTFIITIIGSLVVQNVGVVNQFFFPMVHGIVEITDDNEEWRGISFTYDLINTQDYVIYDSFFWTKEVINDANSESDVLLRVKDAQGNIIIDEIHISPGKGIKLEDLKKNTKYFFEIKAPEGRYTINAV